VGRMCWSLVKTHHRWQRPRFWGATLRGASSTTTAWRRIENGRERMAETVPFHPPAPAAPRFFVAIGQQARGGGDLQLRIADAHRKSRIP